MLTGLRGRAELNGSLGTVCGADVKGGARFPVHVTLWPRRDMLSSGRGEAQEYMKLRPDNLRPLPVHSSPSPAPPPWQPAYWGLGSLYGPTRRGDSPWPLRCSQAPAGLSFANWLGLLPPAEAAAEAKVRESAPRPLPAPCAPPLPVGEYCVVAVRAAGTLPS
jgi:hypothetical protein